MTPRGLEPIRFTVPAGDRVAVAVTQDLRVVVAVPDGQAEVDVDDMTAALAECEAYIAAARRVGLRAVGSSSSSPVMIGGRTIGAAG